MVIISITAMMNVPKSLLALLLSVCSIVLCMGTTTMEQKEILGNIFTSVVAQKTSNVHDLVEALGLDEWSSEMYPRHCLRSANNYSALVQCLSQSECLSHSAIQTLYSIKPEDPLTREDVDRLSPALIYSLLSCGDSASKNNTEVHHAPSSEATWGYGFLFVTLINLCALFGALLLPCMKLKIYKLVLMFMVSVAVGTLIGSGLLFLIPEAFLLVHDGDTSYIWKATTVVGGVYLFFIIEKVMRLINDRRENTAAKKKRDEMATCDSVTTSFHRKPLDNHLPGKELMNTPPHFDGICSPGYLPPSPTTNSLEEATISPTSETTASSTGTQVLIPSTQVIQANGRKQNGHRHSHGRRGSGQEDGEVAPVAYMIIFGDALHNFIDGLSIGSAFTQSIMTGVSVSVAVMCEELPHELGDFAILLNSGMPFRRALLYNFLSACTCYLGLIVGVILGENTHSAEWVFALAGGMFLYISLSDMMPEMSTAAESPEGIKFGPVKTFLLQTFGLLFGYSIMIILALYGGNISFE